MTLVRSLCVAAAVASASACTRSDPGPALAPVGSAQWAEAADLGAEPGAVAKPGPVLVELYTSQGCSSCPPADRLLSQIGEGELGDDVIPLAFHVDYWNYIGWSDPFSSKTWTARQRALAGALGSSSVYTPMLIVNGRAHVVGSNGGKVRAAITAARERGATVALKVKRGSSVAGAISADVEWSALAGADVFVAVTESGLRTSVRRGENSGRQLENDHIVRALVRLEAGANDRVAVKIPLDPSWDEKALKLVAFARDRRTLAVLGAASE